VTLFFNPFDPTVRANPYPHYEELRRDAPVHRSPFGSIVLMRYDDVVRTLRDLPMSRDIEANLAPIPGVQIPTRPQRTARSILNLDPPDHTRLRRLVSKAFTPSAIDRLRPRVQEQVDAALHRMAEQGVADVVEELAFPVPFAVISDLLAMPTENHVEVREWSQALTQALEPIASADDYAAAAVAVERMADFVTAVIEERRRHLGDDLLSAMIEAEEAGDRMSTEELVAMVVLLYVAGHETTVNLIGNGLLALLRHPDQLARWRDDPSLDAHAVDELLRFDGPVQFTARVAMETVRFDDEVVEPGTLVMPVLGSANHDPAHFDEPERLDLGRANANRHLAFSSGIHYCLGASLARAEAQVALGSLIRRFPSIELVEDPVWRDRITIRGPSSLRVAVGA